MSPFFYDQGAEGDAAQSQGNQMLPASLYTTEQDIRNQTYNVEDDQTGPYYIDGQQPAIAFTSTNPLQDAMTADSWFWDTADKFTKADGVEVAGTYRQLYEANPDLQQLIYDMYQSLIITAEQSALPAQGNDDFAQFLKDFEQRGPDPSQTLLDAMRTHANTPVQATSADGAPDSKAGKSSAAPGENVMPQAQAFSTKTSVAEAEQSKVAEQGKGKEAEDEAEEEFEKELSKRTASAIDAQAATSPQTAKGPATLPISVPTPAPRQSAANAPPYIADIASPAEAHEIVDHPDPKHCRKLNVDGDDFEDVKTNKLHFYAKHFFDAMLTPGVQNPAGHVLIGKAKEKFDKQQVDGLNKIQNLLKTAVQQKEARADCILAFEAAVFAHEIGVPKELYDKFKEKGARKSDRHVHLDLDSTCSQRIEKMVQQVADYKLVAVDLLTGKKMHRLAWDPLYYSEQKIGYLISNTTRQTTTDMLNAERVKKLQEEKDGKQGAKTAPAKKRKRTPKADAEQDTEEDGEEDQEEPDAKRMK
ncbi:hypothetical protein LTR85_004642 [Meristemomyces frigidus]|nr:hypothetical protein LTR85_004642 [Meristemomyces frigidus]